MLSRKYIGQAIRQMRKNRKLSRMQLATAIGVFPSNISRIESQTSKTPTFRISTIYKIADAFGCPGHRIFLLAEILQARKEEDILIKVEATRDYQLEGVINKDS